MKAYIFYFLVLILPLACSSPQKSFEKGNYEDAYNGTLKEYKKGNRSRQSKEIMNRSFEELIKETNNTAERKLRSDIIENWEAAYESYSKLVDLYYDGKGYIDGAFDSPMSAIEQDRDALGIDIGAGFFELGQNAMDDYERNYDKAYAQNAFEFYEKAQLYDASITDIQVLKEEALSLGIVKVLVEADSPFEYTYLRAIDRVFSDVERESEGFNQIYYKRNAPNSDCVLELDFSRLDIDTRFTNTTDEFSEEISDGFETRVDTSGRSVRVEKFITVSCTVTTRTENIAYNWRAAASTRSDRNSCNFNNQFFDARETVSNETYQVTGDRRALPSRYQQGASNNNRRREDVIEDMIEDIYYDFVRYYF